MNTDTNQNPAPLDQFGTSGAVKAHAKGSDGYRLACRMLRQGQKLDMRDLKPPRPSESLVDWLVRAGIAQTPQDAAEGLLRAARLTSVRDELLTIDPTL